MDGLEYLFGRWPSKQTLFPNLQKLSFDSYLLSVTDLKRFELSSLRSLSLYRIPLLAFDPTELVNILNDMTNLQELTIVNVDVSTIDFIVSSCGHRLTRLSIDSDIRVLKQIPLLSRISTLTKTCIRLENLYLRRFNLAKWLPSKRGKGDEYQVPFGGKLRELALVECRSNKTGGFVTNLLSLAKSSPKLKNMWISAMDGVDVVNASEQASLDKLRDLVKTRKGYTSNDPRNLCIAQPEEKIVEEPELSFLDQPIAAIPLPDIGQLSSSPLKGTA